MPAHTVSNRKKTIMGSRRLHRVYRNIMNNKALTVALMAIVAPLVGLLMTSKGMPTSHYEELRKALAKLPFGRFLAKLIQQLVDVVRRLLGFGICEGDVVKIRDMDEVAIRTKSLAVIVDGNHHKIPQEDDDPATYKESFIGKFEYEGKTCTLNEESEFIVYRIRRRELQLILCDAVAKQYSIDELKGFSVTTLKKKRITLITNAFVLFVCKRLLAQEEESTLPEDTCCSNPDTPYGFPQEHFEKSDFKLDVQPV